MTPHGTLLPERTIESESLGGSRTIRIYLPPSYHTEPRRRFPVLYLHDGQNVFSSAGPDSCYGWGSWELDVTADWMVSRRHMREIIMVGVDNSRSRYREYRGAVHLKGAGRGRDLAAEKAENLKFTAYAHFLAKELKPAIDRELRTLKTASTTGVMGSSLGGIASLSLGWEYPRVFGRVACLSGSFQIEHRNFLEGVLRGYRGKPKALRIYLDSGTVDFGGDDDSQADTADVVAELRRIGFKDGRTLRHFTDLKPLTEEELARTSLPQHKWGEALASQHNEFYWRLRVWRALEFLFPPLD